MKIRQITSSVLAGILLISLSGCAELVVEDFTYKDGNQIVVDTEIGDQIDLKIRNTGDRDAGSFTSGLYISRDSVITRADIPLTNGRKSTNSLATNASTDVGFDPSVSVPGSAPVGPAYLGVIVDENNTVREYNNSNNTSNIPIEILVPTKPKTDAFNFLINGRNSVPFELFNVQAAGSVEAVIEWTGASPDLTVQLTGRRRPGIADPTTPYVEVTGTSPLTLNYTITSDDLGRGVAWRLVILDKSGHWNAKGTIKLTIPYNASLDNRFQTEKVALRSGDHWPSAALQARFMTQLSSTSKDGIHGLISLNKACDCFQSKTLEQLGILRQSYLPMRNAIGKVRKGIDLSHPDIHAALRAFTPLEPEDKVDPYILLGDYAHFVVEHADGRIGSYIVNNDASLKLSVLFPDDISASRIRAILRAESISFRAVSDRNWTVNLMPSSVVALASYDEVEWIGAGPVPFLPINNNTRNTINVNAVQNAAIAGGGITYTGLTGAGVTVGIQDNGIDATHPDLNVVADNPGGAAHGSHVAGIVAASGIQSTGVDVLGAANGGTAFQWRGMAPNASLVDSFDLITTANLLTAIQGSSLDLSNHSHILGVDGNYNASNRTTDREIRGGASSGGTPIPRRPAVYGSANNGTGNQYGNQIEYYSVLNQLKNAVVVGAWVGGGNPLAGFSSMGPAYDGRIKPDVLAPGVGVISASANVNARQVIDFITIPAGGGAPVPVTPTQGSFTLTFNGQVTAAIAFNASNTTVLNRLNALGNIAAGDVSITGGPLPAMISVNFAGNFATRPVANMTSADTGLDAGMQSRVRTPQGGAGVTGNGYRGSSGTSMASPAVAGVIAQMLEGWQNTYSTPLGVSIDNNPPLPSTIRALLIQTATDVVNPAVRAAASVEIDPDSVQGNADDGTGTVTATVGPDYSTGWGLVNAQTAVNMLQNVRTFRGVPIPKQIIQGSATQNLIQEYDFVVDATGPVRVTLAWDDIESAVQNPASNPMLVNDLDLELVAPDGTVFYPWQLGHTIQDTAGNPLANNAQPPGTNIQVVTPRAPVANPVGNNEYVPANAITGNGNWVARPGKDHLNNVEQVSINAMQTGHWKARVLGFDIPSGAQDYSVVGYPYPDLPELVVSAENKVGLPNIGNSVTFTWAVDNVGPLASGLPGETFNYQILLSRDFALGDDQLLVDSAQTALGPVPAGGTLSKTSTVTITQAAADNLLGNPAGTTTVQDLIDEDVFLLVRADSDNTVLEHEETNIAFVQLARLTDVILVMDQSGSMGSSVPVSSGSQTKMQILQDSASLFLDLIRLDAGDRVAEVKFANSDDVIWGPGDQLTAITSTNITDAKTPIAGLSAGGATNIRAGLQQSLDLLPSTVDEARRKVVIFFSDGMRTAGGNPTQPSFLSQFTSKDASVFSVGFGTEGGGGLAGIDIPLLQTLSTSGASGFFHVTSDPLGLDKFFVDAVAGAIDADVIVDPIANIASGSRKLQVVPVSQQDYAVNFVLTWDNPAANLNFSLQAPSGQIIHSGNVTAFDQHVSRKVAPAYFLYKVRMPLGSGPDSDHGGDWKMIVDNPGSSTVRYSVSAFSQTSIQAQVKTPVSGSGVFSPGDNIRLNGSIKQNSQQELHNVTAVVTPSFPIIGLGDLLAANPVSATDLTGIPEVVNGEPVSLQERMFLALIRRLRGNPMRQVQGTPFPLNYSDSRGFSGNFSGTRMDGVYSFLVGMEGLASNCDSIRREVTTSVGISPATDPKLTDVTVTVPGGSDGTVVVTVTPVGSGGYLGPGLASDVSVGGEGFSLKGEVEDNGDGSYGQTILVARDTPAAKIIVAVRDNVLSEFYFSDDIPAPANVVPTAATNNAATQISISVAQGGNLAGVSGVLLKMAGITHNLTGVSINTSANTIQATVPAGLTPGLYQLSLEGQNGQGASSTQSIFRVLNFAGGPSDGSTVAGVSASYSQLLNAENNDQGLMQLGELTRLLHRQSIGPRFSKELKRKAINEVMQLMVSGKAKVEESELSILPQAVSSLLIDSRYIDQRDLATPRGELINLDMDSGIQIKLTDVVKAGHSNVKVITTKEKLLLRRKATPAIIYKFSTSVKQGKNGAIFIDIPFSRTDYKNITVLGLYERKNDKWVKIASSVNAKTNSIQARLSGSAEILLMENK